MEYVIGDMYLKNMANETGRKYAGLKVNVLTLASTGGFLDRFSKCYEWG